MKDLKNLSLKSHKKYKGKLEVISKISLKNKRNLNLFYTPGVAFPCMEIFKNPAKAYDYTFKSRMIAVVTDGSAVLGLGNIGAAAALPVMEGKCALYKEFADIDSFPICINTQDSNEIIKIVKEISPTFGAIHLEDISAPRCFEIEEILAKELDIPVFHDDQQGTAMVCLAGIINALKVVNKKIDKIKIVISGAGAAGIAITKLLLKYGVKNIILLDSKGIIYTGRGNLNYYKEQIAKLTNKSKIKGNLEDAIAGADVFIGVSKPNVLTKSMVKKMNKDAIIFAMANPVPEIDPKEALEAGARIVATGRSDYPNQINNVLVYPGFLKGVLKYKIKKITDDMKINAAIALSNLVKHPSESKIIPSLFEKGISDVICNSLKNA